MLSPYCDSVRTAPLQLTCRQDQLAVAVCNLQKFSRALPPEYQVQSGEIDIFGILDLTDLLQLNFQSMEPATRSQVWFPLKIIFHYLCAVVFRPHPWCCRGGFISIWRGGGDRRLLSFQPGVQLARRWRVPAQFLLQNTREPARWELNIFFSFSTWMLKPSFGNQLKRVFSCLEELWGRAVRPRVSVSVSEVSICDGAVHQTYDLPRLGQWLL